MPSKTEVANMAISHLVTGKTIGAFETEQTQEAKVCRLFWDTALDLALRDFDWPFATKLEALAQEEEDPNTEWPRSYRYPSDCIKVRRILSGRRSDTRESKIPYRIGQDDEGQLIFCDLTEAEVEYTVRVSDPSRWPPDYLLAFTFLLATYIAPRMTGGDPYKLGQRAGQMYEYHIAKAKANAAGEEQPDLPTESEFIRERQ